MNKLIFKLLNDIANQSESLSDKEFSELKNTVGLSEADNEELFNALLEKPEGKSSYKDWLKENAAGYFSGKMPNGNLKNFLQGQFEGIPEIGDAESRYLAVNEVLKENPKLNGVAESRQNILGQIAAERKDVSLFDSMGQGFADMATAGMAGPIAAQIRPGDYDVNRSKIESEKLSAAKSNPKGYLLGQVGGAVVDPLGAGLRGVTGIGKLAKNSSTLDKIMSGIGIGSTSGASQGVGRSLSSYDQGAKNDISKELQLASLNALLGTAVGGGVGAVTAPIVGALSDKIIKPALNLLSKRGLNLNPSQISRYVNMSNKELQNLEKSQSEVDIAFVKAIKDSAKMAEPTYTPTMETRDAVNAAVKKLNNTLRIYGLKPSAVQGMDPEKFMSTVTSKINLDTKAGQEVFKQLGSAIDEYKSIVNYSMPANIADDFTDPESLLPNITYKNVQIKKPVSIKTSEDILNRTVKKTVDDASYLPSLNPLDLLKKSSKSLVTSLAGEPVGKTSIKLLQKDFPGFAAKELTSSAAKVPYIEKYVEPTVSGNRQISYDEDVNLDEFKNAERKNEQGYMESALDYMLKKIQGKE